MMKLQDLLHKVSTIEIINSQFDFMVNNIAFDSRKVTNNTLFVAQVGVHVNGHQFIDKAISMGANVIVCEELPVDCKDHVVYIKVTNANEALAVLAANFYQNPSEKLTLVGVTGTNGKTTIASLLYQLFDNLGFQTGLLSTVKVMVGKKQYPATHTTPDSLSINQYLAQMVADGVTHCFMEVSSHGIHQGRTFGLVYDGGIFTNLTHDHLDYHKTFAEYRDTKKIFFDNLAKTAFAITNLDDKNGAYMLQNTGATKFTYAQKTLADFKIRILEKSFEGMLIKINDTEIWTKLVGDFNASNIAAIYGAASMLQINDEILLPALSILESVDGRFQYQVSPKGVVSVVDYAHTPDALKNIIETINGIKNKQQQLITVVGCGGDRDPYKRPVMAAIAAQLSNQVIITSDNPRSEDPEVIIKEMEAGIEESLQHKTLSITDRKQAIKTACKFAKPGDVILIAGKGHENYQEINGIRNYFNDSEIVIETLLNL